MLRGSLRPPIVRAKGITPTPIVRAKGITLQVVKKHVVKETSSRIAKPVDNSLKTKEKTPEQGG